MPTSFDKSKLKVKRIAIYGSGTEAIQLAAALKISKTYEIICFIDDLKALHNRTIWDLQIKSIEYIDKVSNIDEIFLAKPSLNKETIRKVYLKAKKKRKQPKRSIEICLKRVLSSRMNRFLNVREDGLWFIHLIKMRLPVSINRGHWLIRWQTITGMFR